MNKDELDKKQLDDLLAKFTDEVLSGEREAAVEENVEDEEIVELRKTVLLLKSAAEKARGKSDERAQIRSRLVAEWKKTQQAKRSTSSRWNWNLPRFALAGGFAVLVLISVVTLLTPSTSPLTATADGSRSWTPFFVLASIVVVLFIIWRNRHD